ncbi:TPA: hypothetical protein EYP70_07780 [Candidatus Bathyarchaeota archaeon]|nr:hypothetical protein [Candidatus Bathyarchaeota archaeon]
MNCDLRDPWRELELAFDCGVKFRILKHLLLNYNETFTKYALMKATGIKSHAVEEHLKVLVDLGWVKEYAYNPSTYRVNLEDPIVIGLLEFFRRVRALR